MSLMAALLKKGRLSLMSPQPVKQVFTCVLSTLTILNCFPDLIYCGRKLRDDQTLEFYGIQSGSTVHVLRKSWPEPEQKPGKVVTVGRIGTLPFLWLGKERKRA